MTTNLCQQKCLPCEGGVKPLHDKEILPYLTQIPKWLLVEENKINKIQRDLKCKDFKQAMILINKVADLAEIEGHHPDILLYGWNHIKFTLYTHAIKGLSENDFILAAKIDKIIDKQ